LPVGFQRGTPSKGKPKQGHLDPDSLLGSYGKRYFFVCFKGYSDAPKTLTSVFY